jgi:hypothetical protein
MGTRYHRPRNWPLLGFCVLAGLLATEAEAKLLKWTCTYPVVANANGAFGKQEYRVEFDVDTAGRAVIFKDTGSSDVELFAGLDSITFLEKLDSGAVRATTIDKFGSSVLSRHIVLKGRLVPSQSYGRCSVR